MNRILWISIVFFVCQITLIENIKNDKTSIIGIVSLENNNQPTRTLMNNKLFLMIKDENNHQHIHVSQMNINEYSFPFHFNLTNIQDIQQSGVYFFSLLIFGFTHRLLWESILFRRHLIVHTSNHLNFTVKDVSNLPKCLMAGYPCLDTDDKSEPFISVCCYQMKCEQSNTTFRTCNGGYPGHCLPMGIRPVLGLVDKYSLEITEKIIQSKLESGIIIKMINASFIVNSDKKDQLQLYLTIITSQSCSLCLIKSKQLIEQLSIPFKIPFYDGSSTFIPLQQPMINSTNENKSMVSTIQTTEMSSLVSTIQTTEMSSLVSTIQTTEMSSLMPTIQTTEMSSLVSTIQTTEMSSLMPTIQTTEMPGLISTESVLTSQSPTTMNDFEIQRNVWIFAENMIYPRYGHRASVLLNGLLLITGGFTYGNVAPFTELYDPSLNLWTSAANMAPVQIGHTASVLSNGSVLVIGGLSTEGGYVNTAELFNPSLNIWTSAANMIHPRSWHTASILSNGSVLVVGGDLLGVLLNTVELFNPSLNIWTSAANMTYPRSWHTASVLSNDSVLVIGGDIDNRKPTETAGLYNTLSDTWKSVASMTYPRSVHTASVLSNGSVLVIGGRIDNRKSTETAEFYDTLSNTWKSVANMTYPRAFHTATVLKNDLVLVTGGDVSDKATNTAELYNPLSNTWLLVENMHYQRSSHTASLLQNNSVLVVGGLSANYSILNSTETYHF